MKRVPGWEDDEPGLREIFGELGRLKRRALARPLVPLLLALAVALAAVGMRARKARIFESQVVLRVTESDLDALTAPRPAKELRAYVLDVAFSKEALLELIHRFDLYPRQMRRDPSYAVEAMRDDLEVEVWRNYFLEARDVDDPGRTARIAVSYRAKDPHLACDVARALGELIVAHEEKSRTAIALRTAELASADVEAAQAELVRRQGEIVSKELAARFAPPAQATLLEIEAANLQKSIATDTTRLTDLVKRKGALSLRAAMESRHLGLRFELIDPGHPQDRGLSRPKELGAIGLVVFLFCLPLGALAAGAFDGRVYDLDDVRRLGLEPLGHVEPFPGDNVGALDARLAREHHVE
jgi:hypothetical protein